MVSIFAARNTKCCRDFCKEIAVRQEQQHSDSYTCTNLTTFIGFRNPFESPIQKGWEALYVQIKNICLLSKWQYKLLNEEGVWQELLHNQYLHSKTLAHVEARSFDSSFWKGLRKVKPSFFNRGSFVAGDGQ